MIHANSPYPHPGKYEGQRMLLVLTHEKGYFEEGVGDVSEYPFEYIGKYSVPGRDEVMFIHRDERGFVSETNESEFIGLAERIAENNELDDALMRAADALNELESQEYGPCGSCLVKNVMAGGYIHRIHEAGCPRDAKLREARKYLARLEDY